MVQCRVRVGFFLIARGIRYTIDSRKHSAAYCPGETDSCFEGSGTGDDYVPVEELMDHA